MKDTLSNLLTHALAAAKSTQLIPDDCSPVINLERPKREGQGDFSSNLAMLLAKPAKRAPREIAQALVEHLPSHRAVTKVEIAGPGFINFFIDDATSASVISDILGQGETYGRSQVGHGQKVQVEFVSANPTGPLHVGHGRGAAYGATVANLLAAAGFEVQREYYVNDAGRQMHILATSVWLRYLELCGEAITFPSNGYKGDYIYDIARQLQQTQQDNLRHPVDQVFADIAQDAQADGSGDKEAHIDDLVARAQQLLGDNYLQVFNSGLDAILGDIRDDLSDFGIEYDCWYSERSLSDNNAVQHAIDQLQAQGHIYEKGGALWFRSSALGDEKDRVVVRDNGQTTYFASDIAYHWDKFQRGFDRVINIWGADHHGYIPRVKAALSALDLDATQLDVLLVQFAILYRGGEKVQMSTRSGSFVTLRELRDEVGNDAARFFYVMRKSEQHMDFDLDLAKSQSNDNPLYYIQYAHARVCSMQRKLADSDWQYDAEQALAQLTLLSSPQEQALISQLSRYPEVLEAAALNHEPHSLINYLRSLAGDFHTCYNAHKVLIEQDDLRNARLALALAAKQVFANALQILGVSAPEVM